MNTATTIDNPKPKPRFHWKCKHTWKQSAHNPGISAIEARSAIGESEALIDPDGLGAFKVVEWLVESNSQVA